MTIKTKHILYYDNSHLSVLLQRNGSVLPLVFPYAVTNVLLTFAIYYAKQKGYDLSFSDKGHGFMAIMISFLVVTRSQIVYGRFMEARAKVGDALRNGREIVYHTSVLTSDRKDEGAKEWRIEIAYQTIVLLRITMKALAFSNSKKEVWEGENKKFRGIMKRTKRYRDQSPLYQDNTYKEYSSRLDNLHAPILIALNLRQKIMSQRTTCFKENRIHVNEELKMLQFVQGFITEYSGLMKLVTTQFPFPLVQMARFFLFIWLYSLPFVLTFTTLYDPVQIMIEVFFITYGFIGIEQVSMALDDPFGDDPTDFDDDQMLEVAVRDILIAVQQTDGDDALEALQSRLQEDLKSDKMDQVEVSLGIDSIFDDDNDSTSDYKSVDENYA